MSGTYEISGCLIFVEQSVHLLNSRARVRFSRSSVLIGVVVLVRLLYRIPLSLRFNTHLQIITFILLLVIHL